MSGVGISGRVTVVARRHGEEVYRFATPNRIVATGRNVIRDLLAGRGKPPKYIALGTGTTTVSDLNTALAAEALRRYVDRVVPSEDEVRYEVFISESEGNGDLLSVVYRELGLFVGTRWETGAKEDTETRYPLEGGVLVARAKIAPVTKTSDVTLSAIWELRVESQT